MEPPAPSVTEDAPAPLPPRPPAAGVATAEHDHDHDHGHDHDRQSFFKRRIAPLGAALIALLAKIKSVVLLLGNIKLFATAATMAVSVAAYATIWGVWFAIGFVILLLVHEMGHVIALRREGIPASAPMFVPFLGALITSRSLGDDAAAEARVGLAGPILGSVGAAACILIWKLTGHDYWRALGYTGFFLNLFNLLPVVPLDGGRAMAAMTPWMWFVGFAGMVALVFVFHNPVMIVIVVLAGYETYRRWQQRRAGGERQQAYYRVSPRTRLLVGAFYLSLIALLVVGMSATHLPRTLG